MEYEYLNRKKHKNMLKSTKYLLKELIRTRPIKKFKGKQFIIEYNKTLRDINKGTKIKKMRSIARIKTQ